MDEEIGTVGLWQSVYLGALAGTALFEVRDKDAFIGATLGGVIGGTVDMVGNFINDRREGKPTMLQRHKKANELILGRAKKLAMTPQWKQAFEGVVEIEVRD